MAERSFAVNIKVDASQALKDLREIAASVSSISAPANQAAKALKNIESSTISTERAMHRLESASRTVASAMNLLKGLVAGIAFKKLADEIVDTAVALDQFRQRANVATGSIAETNDLLEFAAEAADKYGVSTKAAMDAITRLAASTKGTSVTLEEVKDLFDAVSLAAGALGLPAYRVELAFLAISQAASKGVATMDDLRRQLGDHIPGIVPIISRALGVTTAQLEQMVEQGLDISEVFKKLPDEIRRTFGGAEFNTLGNNISRLKNAFFDLRVAIADFFDIRGTGSEAIRGLAEDIQRLAAAIEKAPDFFTLLKRAMIEVEIHGTRLRIGLKNILLTLEKINNFGFSDTEIAPGALEVIKGLERDIEEEQNHLRLLEDVLKDLESGTNAAAVAQKNLADSFDNTTNNADQLVAAIANAGAELHNLKGRVFDVRTGVNLLTEDWIKAVRDTTEELRKQIDESAKATSAEEILKSTRALRDRLSVAESISESTKAHISDLREHLRLLREQARAAKRAGEALERSLKTSRSASPELKQQAKATIEAIKGQLSAVEKLESDTKTQIHLATRALEDQSSAAKKASKVLNEQKGVLKDLQDEFERTAGKVNRELTDAFIDAATRGENAFKRLRVAIENIFSDLVLRPVISAALQPLATSITDALFGGQPVPQAGGGGGVELSNAVTAAAVGARVATSGGTLRGLLPFLNRGVTAPLSTGGLAASVTGGLGGLVVGHFVGRELAKIHPLLGLAGSLASGLATGGALSAGTAALLGGAPLPGVLSSAGQGALGALGLSGAGLIGGTILPGLATAGVGFGLGKLLGGVIDSRTGAALAGAGTGAASGAAIGSIIPGLGTAIGAIVGAVAGALGGILGGLGEKENELRFILSRTLANEFGPGALARNPNLFPNLTGPEAGFFTTSPGGTSERGVFRETPFGFLQFIFKPDRQPSFDSKKQLEPVVKILDRLQVSIGNLAAQFTKDQVEAINQALGEITGKERAPIKFTKAIDSTVRGLSNAISKAIPEYGNILGDIFDSIQERLASRAKELGLKDVDIRLLSFESATQIFSLVAGLKLTGAALKSLTDVAASGDIEKLGRAIDAFKRASGLIDVGVFDQVVDVLKRFQQENETLAETFLRGAEAAKSLQTAFSDLNLQIQDLFDLSLGLSQTTDSIRELSLFVENFVPKAELQARLIDRFFDSFQRRLEPFFGKIDLAQILTGLTRTQYRQAVDELINSGQFVGQQLIDLASTLIEMGNAAADLGILIDDVTNRISSLNLTPLSEITNPSGINQFLPSSELAQHIIRGFNERLSVLFGGPVDVLHVFAVKGIRTLDDFNRVAHELLVEAQQGMSPEAFQETVQTLAALRDTARRLGILVDNINNTTATTTTRTTTTSTRSVDVTRALAERIRAIEEQIRQQQRLAETFARLGTRITDLADSLKLGTLSPLSPLQKLQESQRQFERTARLALLGNQEALEKLPDMAQAFLEQSRAFNASSEAFARDFRRVQDILARAGEVASRQKSIAEEQLAVLQALDSGLSTLHDGLRQISSQFPELARSISNDALSVSDAIISQFPGLAQAFQNSASGIQGAITGATPFLQQQLDKLQQLIDTVNRLANEVSTAVSTAVSGGGRGSSGGVVPSGGGGSSTPPSQTAWTHIVPVGRTVVSEKGGTFTFRSQRGGHQGVDILDERGNVIAHTNRGTGNVFDLRGNLIGRIVNGVFIDTKGRRARLFLRAHGGFAPAGQDILVGEHGPEIIRLPIGGHVFTNNQSREMLTSQIVNELRRQTEILRAELRELKRDQARTNRELRRVAS